MTQTSSPHVKTTRLLAPSLSLLLACALAAARGGAQSAPNAPAQNAPAPAAQASQSVRLNVIVIDKAKRSVEDVRQEELRVAEDGAPQTVNYFAREESPVTYALVVDNSGSLRRSMDAIIRTGSAIVAGNKAGDETALIRFIDSEKIQTVQEFTDSSGALTLALEGMYPEGGNTAVIDAVHYAVKEVAAHRAPGEKRRRAIVLLTDGEDRASRYKSEELVKLLRQEDVQVFVIALVHLLSNEGGFIKKNPRDKAVELMNLIAEESGGRAFFPKDAAGLNLVVEEIRRDLRSAFVVGYTPSNAARDGRFRKVQVKVLDAPGRTDRKAVARPGYFAPKGEQEGKEK